jgi:large subunit ribosomal protein L9
MKVLLWQDIDTLGKRGDTVKVADGYARNYLFPRKLASLNTPENLRLLSVAKKKAQKLDEIAKGNCRELAKKLEGQAYTIEVLANDEGVLFGSVTPAMIAELVERESGVKIDPKLLDTDEHIKELGVYPIKIRLHAEVETICRLWVVLADKEQDKKS